MLKILVLMLFATTLLATNPIELDRGSDAVLLSEDNFITKSMYRLELVWTLEKLKRELSIAEAYLYKKYKDCRVEDEESLRFSIKVAFNHVHDWRYMQFIKEKLLSRVTKDVKVGVLLREWNDILLDRIMNIDSFMIVEPDLSGKGERWKLGYKQMSLNGYDVSLSSIIPIDVLNKKDVQFVKYEAAYRARIKKWYKNEENNLSQKMYHEYDKYVLKEELVKHQAKAISADDEITSLKELKQRMVDSILLDLDGETVKFQTLRYRIGDELVKVRNQYLETKEDSLRFVNPLFEELYAEDKDVYFNFPYGFGYWLSKSSVHEKPAQLLQDYQEILFTWKNYHTETIKLFVDELIKEKRKGSQYYLSRAKLTENISKYFDKTRVENGIPSDFFLIEQLLLKKLPEQEKISLKELAVFWQSFLNTELTEEVIEAHFKKNYMVYEELKWMNFLIDLLPSMPTSKEFIRCLHQSEFE
jgi:hypothetical protein